MLIPSGNAADMLRHPLFGGVMLGLVLGKPLGIAGFSYLTVRLGWTRLPGRMRWRHMIALGMLAGIGVTMSIFITPLSFVAPLLQDISKLSVLIASAVSGVAGFIWLRVSRQVIGADRLSEDGEALNAG